MKKLMTLSLLLFAATLSAQQVNDPHAEVREAKGYHGIDVGSEFVVYLTQSDQEAVAVSAAEEKFRERITVEVKNGILHIGYKQDRKLRIGNERKKLKAYISFRQIDQLHISGACNVFVQGVLKADDLVIRQSGASDLKGELDIKKLTVNLSGASDIKVSGSAIQLSVEASGASDFHGFDFVTEICDAEASGASGIRVTVNKELSAEAKGASDVRYKGDGVIRSIRSSGASSVSRG